ncbi:hypothetical protein [Agrobacterium sp. B1(2019)]|uniref:hypothetical protein n=1 Tax=Agrobacterium sp. B1(2019) TaxID=2607032 RepID=UPI0011F0868A|nr:hypothetical protein [Agrobacterium sp. B1(2019)]TZG37425.1 hypothetical protein AGR1_08345 [Agrobacterium sp. B1(2019)]
MADFFNIISNNHISVVAAIGILMCSAGLLLCFFASGKTHGLVLALVGAVFTALPFIEKMTLNKDGWEIITNGQKANAALATTVAQQTKAIEELKLGLAALDTVVKTFAVTPSLGSDNPVIPKVNWLQIQKNLSTSIDNSGSLLGDIQQRQKAVESLLNLNEALIDRRS